MPHIYQLSADIAREYNVSWCAVDKQLKRLINGTAVELYDNKLPDVLKSAAITFINGEK